jgi:predicted deacetylase
MRSARYLIRFDDICPTMNWDVWKRVETLLLDANAKPILAVVPDNRDPHLAVMPARQDFWAQVRRWQGLGWCIALHGYEHRYETADAGLVGINRCSEFAGLPREIQRHKLQEALRIFTGNGVVANAWVAPGHSFDVVTVELLEEQGVKVISDGYFWRPVRHLGMTWVPQQLWRFRPMLGGVWTVCNHANAFGERDLQRLATDLERYRAKLTDVHELVGAGEPAGLTVLDRLFAWSWTRAVRAKRWLAW